MAFNFFKKEFPLFYRIYKRSPVIRFGVKLMWDDILEFILEIVVELIDFNWNRNKKKKSTHEEIDEDNIKKL